MSSENTFTEEDEAKLRKQIEERYKEREGLMVHSAVFVPINIMLWIIYFVVMPGGFPWPLIVTLGWGSGYVAHLLTYYYKFGGGATRREEAIQREIDQYRERRQFEKPKRDERSHLELSEDGEIEEVYEDKVASRQK